MKNILVNISTKKAAGSINKEYISMYEDIYKKRGIKTINLYKGESINDKTYEEELEQKGIENQCYKDVNEAIELLKPIKDEIVFINTFTEELIEEKISIQRGLGEETTDDIKLFRNKRLQRKLLQDAGLETTVKFIEKSIEELKLEEIENYIGYPFILKPSSGIQSAGVNKIENKNDFDEYVSKYKEFLKVFESRGYNNEIVIAEEYVDGEMYSIDYFVGKNGDINISKTVKVELGPKLGIDDFLNYSRICSAGVEREIKTYDLETFIKDSVKATKIRNTFIHHEFKITSKGEIKTIEMNGRIGGYRPGIYNRAYGINLFDLIFEDKQNKDLEKNDAVILVYPERKGILDSFDLDITKEIAKLESTYSIKLKDDYIGKEAGLTSDGFGKVGIIKMSSTNFDIFEKDNAYIEQNYRKLTILK